MKSKGSDFIFHGLFVHDMVNASSCALQEFLKKYMSGFKVTSSLIMETFLAMEVKQNKTSIKLHMHHYI
jgi:hypothetical protein